jgi:hypothetical protein
VNVLPCLGYDLGDAMGYRSCCCVLHRQQGFNGVDEKVQAVMSYELYNAMRSRLVGGVCAGLLFVVGTHGSLGQLVGAPTTITFGGTVLGIDSSGWFYTLGGVSPVPSGAVYVSYGLAVGGLVVVDLYAEIDNSDGSGWNLDYISRSNQWFVNDSSSWGPGGGPPNCQALDGSCWQSGSAPSFNWGVLGSYPSSGGGTVDLTPVTDAQKQSNSLLLVAAGLLFTSIAVRWVRP